MGDCEGPAIGDECTYDSFGYEYSGIIDCTGSCGSAYGLDDGDCDEEFNCEELMYDEMDCVDAGDDCTTDDGYDGRYDCGMVCFDADIVSDTGGGYIGDDVCDDGTDEFEDYIDLNCSAFGYDGGDCEVESCFAEDMSLGSALSTAETPYVAEGTVDADFSDMDMVDGTCSLWGSSSGGEALYGWVAPTAGEFCFDLYGSEFDTSLAIFDESCGAELACDGDGHSDYTSYTSATLTEGQVVTILVDAYSSYASGAYMLAITEGSCM